MTQQLRYDPEHPVNYFLYECPTCGAQFYGGGPALHKKGCTAFGYGDCICIFGPKQVQEAKNMAVKYDKNTEWWGLSYAMLEQQFPELL